MLSAINKDIELLTNVAINEIRDAYTTGDSKLYGELGKKYGTVAHRVFTYLDAPSKSSETFFSAQHGVFLDPFTVIGRYKDMRRNEEDVSLYDEEFWKHSDMVKSLVEYLSLTQKEINCASA